MALIYDKYYKAIPSSFKVTGAVPMDLRQVVLNLNNLYGQQSQTDKTWEDEKGNLVTYNGMLVTVVDSSAVYLCVDESKPYLEQSWKKVSSEEVDLTEVYRQIGEVSAYVADVSSSVTTLKFALSDVSTFVYNVSTRVDTLETDVTALSNDIADVSSRLSNFGKAFIFKGRGYYNSDTTLTPADINYIVDENGEIIDPLRGGDVYQTDDNKEWVYVEEPVVGGDTWVELGLSIDPEMFRHYVNASTHSQFVDVSTVYDEETRTTTVFVDVSKSTLDSSIFEETGFVTDAQLKTALSWVVLD